MNTRTAKADQKKLTSPLLDREVRLAARKRVIGIWKGKSREMIKENQKIRKEWDKSDLIIS